MGDLSKNFSKWEWEKAGYPVPARYEQNVVECAKNLQVLRDFLGVPIIITLHGGFRPPELNERVGGVEHSQHLEAKAADTQFEVYTPEQVADYIERLIRCGAMKEGGIGIYKTFVHYDVRGRRARWRG